MFTSSLFLVPLFGLFGFSFVNLFAAFPFFGVTTKLVFGLQRLYWIFATLDLWRGITWKKKTNRALFSLFFANCCHRNVYALNGNYKIFCCALLKVKPFFIRLNRGRFFKWIFYKVILNRHTPWVYEKLSIIIIIAKVKSGNKNVFYALTGHHDHDFSTYPNLFDH